MLISSCNSSIRTCRQRMRYFRCSELTQLEVSDLMINQLSPLIFNPSVCCQKILENQKQHNLHGTIRRARTKTPILVPKTLITRELKKIAKFNKDLGPKNTTALMVLKQFIRSRIPLQLPF